MTVIDQQLLDRIVRNAVRFVESKREANRRDSDSRETAETSSNDALRAMQRDIDRLPREYVNQVLLNRK